MKKIPTLFEKEYIGKHYYVISQRVTPGMEWVLEGEGLATAKYDGTAVYYDGKKWYRRFDLKPGRKLPEGAIPCQDAPDEETLHWPHWVPVQWTDSSDCYICEAIRTFTYNHAQVPAGTYEACGEGINGNHYGILGNTLYYHGYNVRKDVPRDYYGLREWLRTNYYEGIVFWLDGEPKCKIRRKDFGFSWPVKEGED